MDDTLNGFRQFKIDNIHNEKETNHTASTLYGYINMPMVNTIYGYQDSELNHMQRPRRWRQRLKVDVGDKTRHYHI